MYAPLAFHRLFVPFTVQIGYQRYHDGQWQELRRLTKQEHSTLVPRWQLYTLAALTLSSFGFSVLFSWSLISNQQRADSLKVMLAEDTSLPAPKDTPERRAYITQLQQEHRAAEHRLLLSLVALFFGIVATSGSLAFLLALLQNWQWIVVPPKKAKELEIEYNELLSALEGIPEHLQINVTKV